MQSVLLLKIRKLKQHTEKVLESNYFYVHIFLFLFSNFENIKCLVYNRGRKSHRRTMKDITNLRTAKENFYTRYSKVWSEEQKKIFWIFTGNSKLTLYTLGLLWSVKIETTTSASEYLYFQNFMITKCLPTPGLFLEWK